MRNRYKLSQSIQRTKSPVIYLKLKERLEDIEQELKESYDKRRNNQEQEALAKMKKDPNSFSSMPRSSVNQHLTLVLSLIMKEMLSLMETQ